MKASLKKSVKGHAAAVYCLIKDEVDHRLFSGSSDRMVGSWSMSDLEPGAFSVNVGLPVFSLYKKGNAMLIGQGEGGIHVLDLSSKKELRHLKYHSRPVFEIFENQKTNHLYSLGGDGNLAIIDSEDYRLLWSIPLSSDKLRTGLIFDEGKKILIGGSDGYIRVLETEYYNVIEEFMGHEGGVYDMKFISASTIVSGGRDGHLRYWKQEGNAIKADRAIPAHNYAIYSIDLSPDGRRFASGSRDKTVKVWNIAEPDKPLRIARKGSVGHTHSVNVVRWIDSETLVSAGDDRDLYFWSISGS